MSSRGKVALAIILAVGVIALGFLWELNRTREALSKVRIERASIKDLSVNLRWELEGFLPSPKVNGLQATLLLKANNPTDHTVEFDELTYEVILEGVRLVSGTKRWLTVGPGENYLEIPLQIEVENVSLVIESLVEKAIRNGFREVSMNYVVKGYAVVPLKLFGFKLPGSIKLPYRYENTYTLSFTPPVRPQHYQVPQRPQRWIRVIEWGWLVNGVRVNSVRPGEAVTAYLKLGGRYEGRVVVM